MHILHIVYLLTYIAYNTHPVLFSQVFEEMCGAVPYQNKRGDLLVATEKMHSIKHVPNDII